MNLEFVDFASMVASISLVISGINAFFYIRDRRNAKCTISQECSNKSLEWHESVLDVLIKLRASSGDEEEKCKKQLLIYLSSLIEQGRFYFPNIKPGEYGIEEPPAYRGYRNLVLDFLVAFYSLHHKPKSLMLDKQAEYLQKLFTSAIYEIIRPSSRLNMIRELTDRYFVEELSVENLERQDQINAVNHIWNESS